MHWPDQIRDCGRLALCALLCFSVHAIAQTDTSTPPKPATPSAKQSHPHAAASTAAKHTSHTTARKSKISRGKKVAKKRGQQAIDPSRAREIQTALIREHYLQGQPTGTWDSTSQAAMQRYQADHGWQSKTTPDARALIKLGLGPSQDHLLNPESAMTATSASADPQSGSAHASALDANGDPARHPTTPAKSTPSDSSIPQPKL
ncbi:MAG: peptidoglycan-binding domain-containing protein [Terriglobales bacterium]